MFGILGEDDSDVNTLKVIVRRLKNDASIPIKSKGYEGCGQLLRKGRNKLQSLSELGCTNFVVCYDSDGSDPKERYSEVEEQVVKPARLEGKCCIVVPVEEIEAWLLADIEAVTNVCSGWRPAPVAYPENIHSPKEYLEKLSRNSNHRPRYSHVVHNEKLAKYVDLKKITAKCRSFHPLQKFVLEC